MTTPNDLPVSFQVDERDAAVLEKLRAMRGWPRVKELVEAHVEYKFAPHELDSLARVFEALRRAEGRA